MRSSLTFIFMIGASVATMAMNLPKPNQEWKQDQATFNVVAHYISLPTGWVDDVGGSTSKFLYRWVEYYGNELYQDNSAYKEWAEYLKKFADTFLLINENEINPAFPKWYFQYDEEQKQINSAKPSDDGKEEIKEEISPPQTDDGKEEIKELEQAKWYYVAQGFKQEVEWFVNDAINQAIEEKTQKKITLIPEISFVDINPLNGRHKVTGLFIDKETYLLKEEQGKTENGKEGIIHLSTENAKKRGKDKIEEKISWKKPENIDEEDDSSEEETKETQIKEEDLKELTELALAQKFLNEEPSQKKSSAKKAFISLFFERNREEKPLNRQMNTYISDNLSIRSESFSKPELPNVHFNVTYEKDTAHAFITQGNETYPLFTKEEGEQIYALQLSQIEQAPKLSSQTKGISIPTAPIKQIVPTQPIVPTTPTKTASTKSAFWYYIEEGKKVELSDKCNNQVNEAIKKKDKTTSWGYGQNVVTFNYETGIHMYKAFGHNRELKRLN